MLKLTNALIIALLVPLVLSGGGREKRMDPKEAQMNTLNKWYNEFNDITRGFDPRVVHEFVESKGIPLPNVDHEDGKFELSHFKQQRSGQKHVLFSVPSIEEPTRVVAVDPIPQWLDEQDGKLSQEEAEEERIRQRHSALLLLKKMTQLPHLLFGDALRDSHQEEEVKEESKHELSHEDSFSHGWSDQGVTDETSDQEQQVKGAFIPVAMAISISSHSSDDKKNNQEQLEDNRHSFLPFVHSPMTGQMPPLPSLGPFPSLGPLVSAILSGTKAAMDDEDCACEDMEQEESRQSGQAGQRNADSVAEPVTQEPSVGDWLRREVEEVPRKPDDGPSPFLMSTRMRQSHLPTPPFFFPHAPEKSWSLDPSDKFYAEKLPQGHQT